MLTKARLRNVKALDYYTSWADDTGAQGAWHTRSSAFAVSDGDVVSRGHLRKIIGGEGARQRVDRHPGFDFTFSCPKSMSLIAFGHYDASVREAVIAVHRDSVKVALDWLEDHSLVTRLTTDGVVSEVPVRGIFAMFQHSTSRALDPQLHTHVLLPNLGVIEESGALVAIDRRILLHAKQAADTIYRLESRARMAELGFHFDAADQNGLADLRGVPQSLIRKYSKRRAEIEASLGIGTDDDNSSPGKRRAAGAKTRDPKLHGERAKESEDCGPLLRSELLTQGYGKSFWDGLRGDPRSPGVVSKDLARDLVTRLLAPASPGRPAGALTSLSSWNRNDLFRALASVLPGGMHPEELESLADLIEKDDRLVPLVYVNNQATRARKGGKGLRVVIATQEDLSVPSSLGLRFTSRALLETETRILDAARNWTRAVSPREIKVVGEVLRSAEKILGFPPSLEQIDLVRHFVCSTGMVSVAVGVPGSGKTTAIKLCREALDRLGIETIALSHKAKSARELGRAAGIARAGTVDSFLLRFDPRDRKTWPERGTVVVIDEASELSTDRLGGLVEMARLTGCRLYLLGDDHQRASIEAGGMFSTLMRFVGGVSLSENLRQKSSHEREAVALLRRGYTESALSLWAEHGQLEVGGTFEDLMTSTLEAWAKDRASGQDSVILCRKNSDASSFNHLARERLIDTGKVRAKPCLVITHKDGSPERRFHSGEQILLTHNDSRLEIRYPGSDEVRPVTNGIVATVVRLHPLWKTLILSTEDGGRMALTREYLGKHTQGAYAFTVAKMQSATVEGSAHVFRPETLSASDLLVAASRATMSTKLHFLVQGGGEAGEGSPAAESAAESPSVHMVAMLTSFVRRQDGETVPMSGTDVPALQRAALSLAKELGGKGTAAYKAIWQRYERGEIVWREGAVDAAVSREDLFVVKLAEAERQLRSGEGDEESVKIAKANLASRTGELRAIKDYEAALQSGHHADRRYALAQVELATMACAYAEALARGVNLEEAPVEAHLGVALDRLELVPGSKGNIDLQNLRGTPEPLFDIAAIATRALPREERQSPIYRLFDLLYSERAEPTEEGLRGALIAAQQSAGASNALLDTARVVIDVAGPCWHETFIPSYRTYCEARSAEVDLRPPTPLLVAHKRIIAIPASPEESEEDADVPTAMPIGEYAPPSAARAVERPAPESGQAAMPERTAKSARDEDDQEDRLALVCRLLYDAGVRATRQSIQGAMDASVQAGAGKDRLAREIWLMAQTSGRPVPGELILGAYQTYLKEHPLAQPSTAGTVAAVQGTAAPRPPRSTSKIARDARAAFSRPRGGRSPSLGEVIVAELSKERKRWPEHIAKMEKDSHGALEMVIWKLIRDEGQVESEGPRPAHPYMPIAPPPEQHNQGHSF